MTGLVDVNELIGKKVQVVTINKSTKEVYCGILSYISKGSLSIENWFQVMKVKETEAGTVITDFTGPMTTYGKFISHDGMSKSLELLKIDKFSMIGGPK